MDAIEKRLNELGITLPEPPENVGSYVPVVRVGNLCFISGQLPISPDGEIVSGTANAVLSSLDRAQEAAKFCAINLLAQLKKYLGSLDMIKRIVRIEGFVRSVDDFINQSSVIDGASGFLVEVFGSEIGAHSRTAVGVTQLPKGAIVEISAIVEVKESWEVENGTC